MIKQRSEEWFSQRACRITASNFSCVLAGQKTKKYQKYKRDIIDNLIGVPILKGDDEPWFAHGKEMETEAIGSYSWEKKVEVSEAGLYVHPIYDFISCSPDGIVGDGIIEAKSRKSLSEHIKSVKAGIDKKYLPQVQGELLVTGKKYCDFISYYKSPETPGEQRKTLTHIHRVYPDEEYQAMLVMACCFFWLGIQKILKEY